MKWPIDSMRSQNQSMIDRNQSDRPFKASLLDRPQLPSPPYRSSNPAHRHIARSRGVADDAESGSDTALEPNRIDRFWSRSIERGFDPGTNPQATGTPGPAQSTCPSSNIKDRNRRWPDGPKDRLGTRPFSRSRSHVPRPVTRPPGSSVIAMPREPAANRITTRGITRPAIMSKHPLGTGLTVQQPRNRRG